LAFGFDHPETHAPFKYYNDNEICSPQPIA
jgi:hypothetical protein